MTESRTALSLLAYLLEQVARKNITVDEAIKLLEAMREDRLTEVERRAIEALR